MSWQEILKVIIEVCILPLLGVLTTFLVKYLQKKSDELISKTSNEIEKRYLEMLTETISACVLSTQQTYVEALKKTDMFTKEAQQKAFQETYENIINILSDDCKNYLEMAFGDLQGYIQNKIEAQVKQNKMWRLS